MTARDLIINRIFDKQENIEWEGYVAIQIVLLFLYAGAIGITYTIMFGG